MSVMLRLEGTEELQARLRNMSDDTRAAVSKVVKASAIEIQATAKKSIRQPGTGTLYFRIYNAENNTTTIYAGDTEGYVTTVSGRLGKSVTHRASADGKPPASDTGRLLNSIIFNVVNDLTAQVLSNLDYATYLEYGTISMNPRPFFRPAIEKVRPKFNAKLETALAQVLK